MARNHTGRRIVYNKIVNQREVLKIVRHKSDALKEEIEVFDGYIVSLSAAKNINEICQTIYGTAFGEGRQWY